MARLRPAGQRPHSHPPSSHPRPLRTTHTSSDPHDSTSESLWGCLCVCLVCVVCVVYVGGEYLSVCLSDCSCVWVFGSESVCVCVCVRLYVCVGMCMCVCVLPLSRPGLR